MSMISKTIPSNLWEEKDKFFADPSYNPQFLYAEQLESESLTKFGLPQKKHLELAKAILEKSYFGRNEADLWMAEGPVVTQQDVTKMAKTFLKLHGLEKRFEIIWSSSFLARAAMTPTQLKLRLPIDFRRQGALGMIYHEVGTHALRRINYEQQPWFKRKIKFGFQNYLATEEGLAVLHALLPHTLKSLFVGAIRYLAVSYAQEHTFAETWQLLSKYVQDPERRWLVAYRAKRGLADTSQPGGFTKDLAYLQGPVETWQWLSAHQYNLKPLYFGKLAAADADKAVAMNPDFEPLLPIFYTKDKEAYIAEMEAIAEFNLLKEL